MNEREPIVALGLLTQSDLEALGSTFERAYPIDDGPGFAGLLEAIDQAERDARRSRDGDGAADS